MIPKKYFQDRVVLLLLSVNTFLVALGTLAILLRLAAGRADSYIVQYRANLQPYSRTSNGGVSTFFSFIIFMVLVLVFHSVLSIRSYPIRRSFSIFILAGGSLLL